MDWAAPIGLSRDDETFDGALRTIPVYAASPSVSIQPLNDLTGSTLLGMKRAYYSEPTQIRQKFVGIKEEGIVACPVPHLNDSPPKPQAEISIAPTRQGIHANTGRKSMNLNCLWQLKVD